MLRCDLGLGSCALIFHDLQHASGVFLLLFLFQVAVVCNFVQFVQLFLRIVQVLVVEVECSGAVADTSKAAETTLSFSANTWQVTEEATAATASNSW